MANNKTKEKLERANVLLKAMCEICTTLDNSRFVLNFFEQSAHYDGTDCDGSCLWEDVKSFLEESKEPDKHTQEEFNKAFNEILEGSTQRYMNPETGKVSKKKTSNHQVLNAKGEWLLSYDTDPNYFYFQYHYGRLFSILREKFSFKLGEFQSLMKSMVESRYKMKGVTPNAVL
jgi:hypothetical protein